MRSSFLPLVCLLVSASLIAVGCGGGDSGTEVYGTVTHNGTALADGDISFVPEGTGAQSSAPIKNGEYRLAKEFGLAPGTYEVRINGYGAAVKKENVPDEAMPPETAGVPRKEQILPEKFNTKSTLEKLTVSAGQGPTEKNYDLK